MSHSAHPGAAEMYRAGLAQECLCGRTPCSTSHRVWGGRPRRGLGTSLTFNSYKCNDGYPTSRPRNLFLRRIIIVLAILYAVGTIFGGMWLGEVATHPGRRPITSAD